MMHNFLRFIYAKKLPELESLVFDPYDYARVVIRLQSVENPSDAVLNDVLTSHLAVAIKIAVGQIRHKELNPTDRVNLDRAAQFVVFLFEEKSKVGLKLTSS
jgi:RNA processing factor Prp31